eukprot:jgi/Galph1/1735/GphlegSOOS_G425.1
MSSTGLGWLTGSSILPKKRRYIARISASSLIGLRAALYREEEEAKFQLKKRRKKKSSRDEDVRNPGVDARASKDEEEDVLKKVENSLEKKTQLYNQLLNRGESDSEEPETGDSEYMVDFEKKSLLVNSQEAKVKEPVDTWQADWKENNLLGLESEFGTKGLKSQRTRVDGVAIYRKLCEEDWKKIVYRALYWNQYGVHFGGIIKEQISEVLSCMYPERVQEKGQ